MESILLLLKNAPPHPDAASGLQMAQHFRMEGNSVDVFLLQDAVMAGVTKAGMLASLLAQGIGCYALGEDLQLRGYTGAHLMEGIHETNYDELTEMMMERHDRVLGTL